VSNRVGFAGDWHGNHTWARKVLKNFAEENVSLIYHVGDFGLWPGAEGKFYLQKVHATAEENNQNLFIVLGNHEDYDRVAQMQTDDEGWLFLKNYPRFRFAPRGHTWVAENGTRMAALGGAASVDKAFRVEGKTWWGQEEITEADCEQLVANVQKENWEKVDVMVTHDAPAGLTRKGMQPKPHWLTPEIEHYSWTQRVRLREALDQVQPRWLVHGHWHEWFRDEWEGVPLNGGNYTCQVVGLDCDGAPRNAITAELIPVVGLSDIKMLVGETWRSI
jgi:Icc-related predicted phosphoesterase